MADDFLAELLNNKMRAKVLRTLLLNQGECFSADEAGKRSGIKGAQARKELHALGKLGIVRQRTKRIRAPKTKKGKLVPAFELKKDFPHLAALSAFVKDVSPAQYSGIIPKLRAVGRVTTIILSGAFMDDPSRPADMVVAGEGVSSRRFERAVQSLEPLIGREIRYAAFSTPEFRYRLTIQDRLLRDTLDYPHIVLIDKTGMLIKE